MGLQSMTGFARSEGSFGRYRIAWEIRSVNGKGLDLRLRLPSGVERLETDVRKVVSDRFSRGNLQLSLTLTASDAKLEAKVNRQALDAILALRDELSDVIDPSPLKFDTLIAMRGIVDIREAEEDEAETLALDEAIVASLKEALDRLQRMRESEGAALASVLTDQVGQIADLITVVESDPSRSPEEIARRLTQQVASLLQDTSALDSSRLYGEAALLATKADLREEIDRLKTHVSAVRELLEKGGPVGRRLDFLAQEFNRESNTICSKSNSSSVTTAGLGLKVVIDQFREQVQNLE